MLNYYLYGLLFKPYNHNNVSPYEDERRSRMINNNSIIIDKAFDALSVDKETLNGLLSDNRLEWVKEINSIDRTKPNGFGIQGFFINTNVYFGCNLYLAKLQNPTDKTDHYILFRFNLNDKEIVNPLFEYSEVKVSTKQWSKKIIEIIEKNNLLKNIQNKEK